MVESATDEVLRQGILVLESAEPIREHIVSTLREMTEVGGVHNFLILEPDPTRNYYVQFATSCGSAVIQYEAVSDRHLSAPLTQAQRDELQRLGWRRPTPRKWPNHFRLARCPAQDQGSPGLVIRCPRRPSIDMRSMGRLS